MKLKPAVNPVRRTEKKNRIRIGISTNKKYRKFLKKYYRERREESHEKRKITQASQSEIQAAEN
jgi:hypothetical protein|tara:strand:+ start:2503 stop:2694 length:192 start_codon:yes stop_codon:yes gene_type:complete